MSQEAYEIFGAMFGLCVFALFVMFVGAGIVSLGAGEWVFFAEPGFWRIAGGFVGAIIIVFGIAWWLEKN